VPICYVNCLHVLPHYQWRVQRPIWLFFKFICQIFLLFIAVRNLELLYFPYLWTLNFTISFSSTFKVATASSLKIDRMGGVVCITIIICVALCDWCLISNDICDCKICLMSNMSNVYCLMCSVWMYVLNWCMHHLLNNVWYYIIIYFCLISNIIIHTRLLLFINDFYKFIKI
jgi:hypothetical protein